MTILQITEDFKNLVSKNGRVRKWYEILKKGTESVVDRIFITGVAPITLDSLTSGFNISKDITRDVRFNEMFGFTEKEVIDLMDLQNISKQEQKKLLPIMKANYDGYKFSLRAKNQIYNSNMCLYLLSDYIGLGRMPESLIDVNIASDYSKLSHMLNICHGEEKKEIIEKTISGEEFGYPKLNIPNHVMKELYATYFLESIEKDLEFRISGMEYSEMAKQLASEGDISKMVEVLGIYLRNLSNRDYIKFDEKYSQYEEMQEIENLHKYTIVAVVDKICK